MTLSGVTAMRVSKNHKNIFKIQYDIIKIVTLYGMSIMAFVNVRRGENRKEKQAPLLSHVRVRAGPHRHIDIPPLHARPNKSRRSDFQNVLCKGTALYLYAAG
jgi:hypothetical protein